MDELKRIRDLKEKRSKRLKELAKKDAKPAFKTVGVKSSIKDENMTISDAYMH